MTISGKVPEVDDISACARVPPACSCGFVPELACGGVGRERLRMTFGVAWPCVSRVPAEPMRVVLDHRLYEAVEGIQGLSMPLNSGLGLILFESKPKRPVSSLHPFRRTRPPLVATLPALSVLGDRYDKPLRTHPTQGTRGKGSKGATARFRSSLALCG